MRIDKIQFDAKSVVILGAGATRGASFVDSLNGSVPPLDADFFTQAQRLSSSKPRRFVDQLIKDVVDTFGSNFKLTMEGYLTRIEQLANVHDDYRFRGRPADNNYKRMRANFLQVLAALLDESVGRIPTCKYHTRLVEVLRRDDTISVLGLQGRERSAEILRQIRLASQIARLDELVSCPP